MWFNWNILRKYSELLCAHQEAFRTYGRWARMSSTTNYLLYLWQLLLWLISCLFLRPSHCVHSFQAASFFRRYTGTSYSLVLEKNLWPTQFPLTVLQTNGIHCLLTSVTFNPPTSSKLTSTNNITKGGFKFCPLPFVTLPRSHPSSVCMHVHFLMHFCWTCKARCVHPAGEIWHCRNDCYHYYYLKWSTFWESYN